MDLTLAEVIDEAGFRQMDISSVGSGGESQSSRGCNTVDSQSFDFTDEDFLVVDCRNNPPDTSSLPSDFPKSGSGQSASQTAKTENTKSNRCNTTCSGIDSASGT